MILATKIKTKGSGNAPKSLNISDLFLKKAFTNKEVKDLTDDDLELITNSILAFNSDIESYTLTNATTLSLKAKFCHDEDFRFSEEQINRVFINSLKSLIKKQDYGDYTYTFTKSDYSISIYFAINAETDFAYQAMRDCLQTLIVSVRTSHSKYYVLKEIYDALEGLKEDMYKAKRSLSTETLYANLYGNYSDSVIKLNCIN